MTRSLFGERFYGPRKVLWDGMGTSFSSPVSVSDAIKHSGLLYEVHKVPVTVTAPSGQVLQPREIALVREPTTADPSSRIFGLVSKHYGIVQNSELGPLLDPLAKIWPVQAAGAIGFGETIFMVLTAGSQQVANEELKNFFLLTDTKTGGESLKVFFAPVRVVNQTVLVTGMTEIVTRLTHYSQVRTDLEFYLGLVNGMRQAQEQVLTQFVRFTKTVITDQQVDSVLKMTYPSPRRPKRAQMLEGLEMTGSDMAEEIRSRYQTSQKQYEYAVERTEVVRTGALELFRAYNDQVKAFANTAWALYTAVCETEDYRKGKNAAISALFGPRAKAKMRAFRALIGI